MFFQATSPRQARGSVSRVCTRSQSVSTVRRPKRSFGVTRVGSASSPRSGRDQQIGEIDGGVGGRAVVQAHGWSVAAAPGSSRV
jgi:hypothetical protein